MHLRSLEVENFRAIDHARLDNLPTAVAIAGPNGCGKSCLLDAIRIWKSAYGGYNENEFQQGFSEFGINSSRLAQDLPGIFRDRSKPVRIRAEVVLAESEVLYLRDQAEVLVERLLLRANTGSQRGPGRDTIMTVSEEDPDADRRRDETIRKRAADLRRALQGASFAGEFQIRPTLQLTKTPNLVLELIYSLFLPDQIGIIEYHSAQRHYQSREEITNVDLRLETSSQQQGQQALFNWQQKYQSVKAQLLGNYVRELIAKEAGASIPPKESLLGSLTELFRLFFPDKQFLGAQPTQDGKLTLNVRTASGKEHDISDLSSGEKEVLYGYLRLRNLAPRNSVLLLDEPELHLNPRLIRGLPAFYQHHLGTALSNQLWLVTHSDVLLEEALDLPGFSVYHMVPAEATGVSGNQVHAVTDESLERAIIDLVGEKTAYGPFSKLVIFEGGGESQFDLTLTMDLFPELWSKVNPVSGTNRTRVVELRRLLEKAVADGKPRPRVFSITDRDSAPIEDAVAGRELIWNVYHIENYLLDPAFIHSAMVDALRERCPLASPEAVDAALRIAAERAVEDTVSARTIDWARNEVFGCLRSIGADPRSKALESTLVASIASSAQRVQQKIQTALTSEGIAARRQQYRDEASASLKGEEWRVSLPGRAILRQFTDLYGQGLSYEILRNLIIGKMRAANHRPSGMSEVVAELLKD